MYYLQMKMLFLNTGTEYAFCNENRKLHHNFNTVTFDKI